MNIEELQILSHKIAVEKGWWIQERNIGEMLMLAVTELAEAMEEWRNQKPLFYYEDKKPEGFAVELADVFIRLADLAESLGINLTDVIDKKMEYNKTREWRHGGKLA